MGYYDTQRVAPNAGGQPYNVRDILLATQGMTGGLDKLVADAGVDRKAQQQMKANEYVSGLLGKATPENYQQTLLQAGSMAPYASPEMMNQVKDTRGQMQYDQGVATHALERGQDVARYNRIDTEGERHASVMEGQGEKTITNQANQHAATLLQNMTIHKDDIALAQEGHRLQKMGIQVTAAHNQAMNKIANAQLNATIDNNQYTRAVSNATLEANGGLVYNGKGGFDYNPNSPTYMNNLNVAHNALLRDVGTKFDPSLALKNSNEKYTTLLETDAGVQGRINTAYELINTMTDVNDKKTAIQLLQSGDSNRAFDLASRSIKSKNHKIDMKVNTKNK